MIGFSLLRPSTFTVGPGFIVTYGTGSRAATTTSPSSRQNTSVLARVRRVMPPPSQTHTTTADNYADRRVPSLDVLVPVLRDGRTAMPVLRSRTTAGRGRPAVGCSLVIAWANRS